MIGAGIVGLATAFRVREARADLSIAVVEKERDVGLHQMAHNSGVMHSALSYAPGSLKARFARDGKAALERFCDELAIPYERCGKLVVATNDAEVRRLGALVDRGRANGVDGMRLSTGVP